MNKINRGNYEAFALSYLEDAMDAPTRLEFESFLAEAPDIAEELAEMGLTSLQIETEKLEHKAALYQSEPKNRYRLLLYFIIGLLFVGSLLWYNTKNEQSTPLSNEPLMMASRDKQEKKEPTSERSWVNASSKEVESNPKIDSGSATQEENKLKNHSKKQVTNPKVESAQNPIFEKPTVVSLAEESSVNTYVPSVQFHDENSSSDEQQAIVKEIKPEVQPLATLEKVPTSYFSLSRNSPTTKVKMAIKLDSELVAKNEKSVFTRLKNSAKQKQLKFEIPKWKKASKDLKDALMPSLFASND